MATIRGNNRQSDVNLSKFLGLYEAEDGDTQMKYGVSPNMENFEITENYHLKTRPGKRYLFGYEGAIRGLWAGYKKGEYLVFVVAWDKLYRLLLGETVSYELVGYVDTNSEAVTFFSFDEKIFLLDGAHIWEITGDGEYSLSLVDGYIPTVVTGAAPSGGGTTLEAINLLTPVRKAEYSADGSATEYTLPEKNIKIQSITVDGIALSETLGEYGWDTESGIVTFKTAPTEGINNVLITYYAQDHDDGGISKMRFAEAYNGATDTRIFLYGDGSNRCYYSGVTMAGVGSATYFPAMNEISVADSNSPITGLLRHYSRLMVFKPDGTFAIHYDTLTLEDGTVTAGFYVRPMHRALGSSAMGQLAMVQNFPRTFCQGTLYDWKQTASYYQDERYARVVSEPVQFTMRRADADTLFMWDDDIEHRYYIFLNDAEGTVLVNAYEQEVWFKYTGFRDVHFMTRAGERLLLASHSAIYELSDKYSYDYEASPTDEAQYLVSTINSYWESGHMAFGAENTRKYSSHIWVTLAPGLGATILITARSDRRPDYAEKVAKMYAANTTGLFDNVDFSHFSFDTYVAPETKRIKLKVKKFVFYKLILQTPDTGILGPANEIGEEGDGGYGSTTVLNITQRVRFSGDAK